MEDKFFPQTISFASKLIPLLKCTCHPGSHIVPLFFSEAMGWTWTHKNDSLYKDIRFNCIKKKAHPNFSFGIVGSLVHWIMCRDWKDFNGTSGWMPGFSIATITRGWHHGMDLGWGHHITSWWVWRWILALASSYIYQNLPVNSADQCLPHTQTLGGGGIHGKMKNIQN